MAVLSLIGEPFPDADADAARAATIELTRALAATAPRGCGARLLVSRESTAPDFDNLLIEIETIPIHSGVLPRIWQNGTTARPLDGEFVHAMTPLVPLRSRGADDGSQTSVFVPHALGWQAPELMGAALARRYRGFVRRAAKYADALLVPNHATATAIQERYGPRTPVQVMPLAPPPQYLVPHDALARRDELDLPETYLLTDAVPGEHGRLELLFGAMLADLQVPPLAILTNEAAREALLAAVPLQLRERVHIVVPGQLSDVGAVLGGAALLLQPQAYIGAGYELLGALAAGVPVLHLGSPAIAETVLDAGVEVQTEDQLLDTVTRLLDDRAELERLGVLAVDRARSFTWTGAAWQLWELHANI